MNELMKFENAEFGEVRMVKVDGKEMFVAKDIARALGYAESSLSSTISKKCKNVVKSMVEAPCQNGNVVKTQTSLIGEGDIYRLIVSSPLPSAEKFESWVFDEVLPSIRQTGGYIPVKDEDDEATIMAKALMIAQKTIDKKQEIIQQQQQVIEEQKPKVEGYEQFMDTENGLEWDTVAKNLGVGRNIMLRKLRELKILQTDVFEYKGKTYTGDSHNIPYQQYMKYFEVKYVVKEGKRYPKVLVLPTGQEYIRKRLSEE